MTELELIYSDPKAYFRNERWRNGVYCPRCGSIHIYEGKRGYCCRDCGHRFSDTSGTFLHGTKLPLLKWLLCMYHMLKTSRGVSSYNMAKIIGVSQPTAWLMMHKIRQHIPQERVSGEVAADEVYLGPNIKRMAGYRKAKLLSAAGYSSGTPLTKSQWLSFVSTIKIPVLGVASKGKLCLQILPRDLNRESMGRTLNNVVYDATLLITDGSSLYDYVNIPKVSCDHSMGYYSSPEGYSSNLIEGIFSNLRRTISGVFGHCKLSNLQYYLNEFSFRYMYRRGGLSKMLGILLH